ncbi:hypothetical protein JCM8097_000451 [Rhodosporidiobolus ruineniae]
MRFAAFTALLLGAATFVAATASVDELKRQLGLLNGLLGNNGLVGGLLNLGGSGGAVSTLPTGILNQLGPLSGLTSQWQSVTTQVTNTVTTLQQNQATASLPGVGDLSGLLSGLSGQLGVLNGLTGQLGGVTGAGSGLGDLSQLGNAGGLLTGLLGGLLPVVTGLLSALTGGGGLPLQ